MEIVIKIPEEIYDFVQNTSFVEDENTLFKQSNAERQKTLFLFDIIDAIRNGTPLPDHHGRIIDESKINNVYKYKEEAINNNIKAINITITHTDAPTIIEADERRKLNE